jgi:hypothetical protein
MTAVYWLVGVIGYLTLAVPLACLLGRAIAADRLSDDELLWDAEFEDAR